MAQDPESRPISVSELLARSRRESGEQEPTAPESGQFSAQGRRRSGRDGSMSVAELTGEIPKITGPEPTARATAPSVAPRSSNPSVVRAESAFPRSSSPAPTAGGSGRTASGMPGMVSRSEPTTPADAQTEVTPPVIDAPATADFNSNAITGIIPVVESTDDDEDLDFEAYRNFADYDDEPAGVGRAKKDKPSKDKPKKDRRGLFGRKKADRSRASAGKGTDVVAPTAAFTGGEPVADDAPSEPLPAVRPSVVPSEPAIVPSVRRSATPPPASRADDDDDSGPAITPHVVARAPETQKAQPEASVEDTTEIGIVGFGVEPTTQPTAAQQSGPGSAVTPSASAAEFGFGATTSAITPTPPEPAVDPVDDFADVDTAPEPHKVRATLRKAIADDTEAGEIPDEAPLNRKHSPLVQWLLLIGQSILGVAVGAGLFWGFTELWKWNVIFALVLAAVVIFGIVTLVHVVRRRHDLISTLLALGVGLVVTIGPLVLLASSSS